MAFGARKKCRQGAGETHPDILTGHSIQAMRSQAGAESMGKPGFSLLSQLGFGPMPSIHPVLLRFGLLDDGLGKDSCGGNQ